MLMNILNFFRPSYKNSRRRAVYELIADVCQSTPQRVYNLAHGMRPEYGLDEKIISELIAHRVLKYL